MGQKVNMLPGWVIALQDGLIKTYKSSLKYRAYILYISKSEFERQTAILINLLYKQWCCFFDIVN